MIIVYFLLWTLLLYWIHRLGHVVPGIKKIHWNHHIFISNNSTTWHWCNLFLYMDTWTSALDVWITEVIPTFVFCLITGQWWIFIMYYLWAAFVQEWIEHNPNIDILFFTFGKWHLVHHKIQNRNFGLIFPQWDIIFGTYKSV